jgi:hypothetical protein
MKICAIDTNDKNWASLHDDVLIYTSQEFTLEYMENNSFSEGKEEQILLVIVHESSVSETLLNNLRNEVNDQILPYIMIVSSDPLDGVIDKNGKTCESVIPFKNNFDLGTISHQFKQLISSLNNIDTSINKESNTQRIKTWNDWNRMELNRIIPSIYILCQGYLIVHALHLQDIEYSLEVKQALYLMNWNIRIKESEFPRIDIEEINKKVLDVKSQVWWRKCLDDKQTDSIHQLEFRIKQEWDSYDTCKDSHLSQLLRVIYDEKNIQIFPELVANAYCDIYKHLN